MTCPRCGAGGQTRPSGDYVCSACGTTWKVVPLKPEVPKP